MRTTLTISDDGVLTIPDEMLKVLGWSEGEELEWVENDDGSFLLRKPTYSSEEQPNEPQSEPPSVEDSI